MTSTSLSKPPWDDGTRATPLEICASVTSRGARTLPQNVCQAFRPRWMTGSFGPRSPLGRVPRVGHAQDGRLVLVLEGAAHEIEQRLAVRADGVAQLALVAQQLHVEVLLAQHALRHRRLVVVEGELHGARRCVERARVHRHRSVAQRVEQVAEQDRAGGVADQVHLEASAVAFFSRSSRVGQQHQRRVLLRDLAVGAGDRLPDGLGGAARSASSATRSP